MSYQRIEEVSERHLHILWTSGDPLTAEHMVMMYARNSILNGWWDEVTVILWGAAQKLVCEDDAVRMELEFVRNEGVEFSACLSCAVELGLEEPLAEMGIEVIRWGEKLSRLMQNGKHVLSV